MQKKNLLKLTVSLGIALLLAILFLILAKFRTYQILELKALDLRFVLKGNRVAQVPLVHIDIDDQSLTKLGRWPWPRSYHARVVDILKECQAKQILMDILFTEKFKDNPKEDALFARSILGADIVYLPFYFIENQTPPSAELKELLLKDINISVEEAAAVLNIKPELIKEKLPSAKRYVLDEVTCEFIHQNPEITQEALLQKIEETLGWFLFPEEETYIRENFQSQKLSRFFIHKFGIDYPTQKWPFKKGYQYLSVPIQEYSENIKGSGFINAAPDLDGVMRRIPLFIKHEDKILPQLTVAALLEYLGIKDIEARKGVVILKNAQNYGKSKDIAVPVDESGCMIVNWQGCWGYSFNHLPYYLILRLQEIREQIQTQLSVMKDKNKTSPQDQDLIEYLKKSEAELKSKLTAMVKDKICLVGLTGTGTHDMRPIPVQENYPMVGIHSNAINTILSQNFIVRKEGGVSVFIFFLTALVIGLTSLTKLYKSLLLCLFYTIGYFLIAFLLFIKFGLWIDLVGPVGIVIFGFSSITSFRYFTEEKEKLWIKHAFSHYLSKEVINELLENPSKLKLGGERRNLTVFFADVRGFTNFSESHQPEEVVAALNEIFTESVNILFKYNGTLDKFVGDQVMAFFGAPGESHLDDHEIGRASCRERV